jgi:hypothetical protein
MLSSEWFNVLPKLERTYFNGALGDSEDLLCWTRGQTLKPRVTVMEEVYEVYRTEYTLDTALLRPFFSSRSVPGVPEMSEDEFGKLGGHDRKGLCTQKGAKWEPWLKRIFSWDTISLVILI